MSGQCRISEDESEKLGRCSHQSEYTQLYTAQQQQQQLAQSAREEQRMDVD